ncbi:hypothetical protein [Peribacillus sp. SI8-4]|uniref:hypothetical protein n=1 Tax=Peribacillus sp. SI8-4 TaxID=3048009 RepID=UPI0025537B4A|nr:hypothetical protein [Peribacillus sp. SI8-4]
MSKLQLASKSAKLARKAANLASKSAQTWRKGQKLRVHCKIQEKKSLKQTRTRPNMEESANWRVKEANSRVK